MREEGKIQSARQFGVAVGAGVRGRFVETEKRLASMPPRRLILLVIVSAILFLGLGVFLGAIFSPYSPTSPSDTDLSNSQGGGSGAVSQTGILRKLSAPLGEIEFYLEQSDGTQVFLVPTSKIDTSFLEGFVGLAVTIEGTAGKSADGTQDVLRIEKVVLKQ